MQGGQVSVWVPIVVGVIGVFGVVAGQLINWWNEGRRWKRELEREEVRLRHENVQDWRETRIRTYGALLALLHEFLDVIAKMRPDGSDQKIQEYKGFRPAVQRAVSEAELICSRSVRNCLQNYHVLFVVNSRLFPSKTNPIDGRKLAGPLRVTSGDHYQDVTDYIDELTDLIRAELGVDASAPFIDQRGSS